MGFNPYFVGSESGRPFTTLHYSIIQSVSILILLEVSLEGECTSNIQKLSDSFNPYFVGSESGSGEMNKVNYKV